MARVQVKAIEKTLGGNKILKGVNFDVAEGSIMTLLGPSGCGKSTTLKCLAGLETPDSGEIWIGDSMIVGGEKEVATNQRELGMVFQSYAIWPHMTVFDNVAFGLKLRKTSKSRLRAQTMETLELVGLDEKAQSYPAQLSGGQQQRVALARALVYQPRVILLDEPLSNLDAKLRDQMRLEIVRIQREAGITALYVTHDRTEALSMSDRMCLMQNGQIVQNATPEQIWSDPRTRYVADFLGMPGLLEADWLGAAGDKAVVNVAGTTVTAQITPESRATIDGGAAKPCLMLHMPAVEIVAAENSPDLPGVNSLEGVLVTRALIGDYVEFDIRIGDEVIKARLEKSRATVQAGDRVSLKFAVEQAKVIPDDGSIARH